MIDILKNCNSQLGVKKKKEKEREELYLFFLNIRVLKLQ